MTILAIIHPHGQVIDTLVGSLIFAAVDVASRVMVFAFAPNCFFFFLPFYFSFFVRYVGMADAAGGVLMSIGTIGTSSISNGIGGNSS